MPLIQPCLNPHSSRQSTMRMRMIVKKMTLKIDLTQREAGIVWSTTVLVPSCQSEQLKKKPPHVCVWSYWIVCFSGSVALAMFTTNCTKPLDLLPVNGQNWPNLYFYSPILIAAGISLLKMTPTKGSQKLPSRPINHQILDVLHICAFLSCFLGSGCLTAGTIFHISLHTALMSLCTRLTWSRSWHQVSSTYIMKALNA